MGFEFQSKDLRAPGARFSVRPCACASSLPIETSPGGPRAPGGEKGPECMTHVSWHLDS